MKKSILFLLASLYIGYWLTRRQVNNASNARKGFKDFIGSQTIEVNDTEDAKFSPPVGANYVEFQAQGGNIRIRQSIENDGGIIVYKDAIASFNTYEEMLNAKIRSIAGRVTVYANYFNVALK